MDKRVEPPKTPDETPVREPHAPDEKGRVRPRRVLPWVLLAVAVGAIALFALRPHGAPAGGPAG
ncbi:hypothetical protein, partial [Burkholderia sp. Ax-1719]|uniref:hypothetical protein n=1 Tax=Burkholderia sp. Ax-1719 TaxID=2608334 RepID=UPI0014238153